MNSIFVLPVDSLQDLLLALQRYNIPITLWVGLNMFNNFIKK